MAGSPCPLHVHARIYGGVAGPVRPLPIQPTYLLQSPPDPCCARAPPRRHIVLAVHHPASGQWGALGISRRRDLMDKPLGSHGSLADLMQDYKVSAVPPCAAPCCLSVHRIRR